MAKKRKIDIGRKKEFTFKGLKLEEVQKLSLEELLPHLKARQRRSLIRGFTEEQNKLLKKLQKSDKNVEIKTHRRDMVILPEFVGRTIAVHNGTGFIKIKIQPEMIGHFLGEFALTRKDVKHTGPGVGATRSSKYMPLK
jgi:small subunit ribosomal protein S19